jgi:hypothetical protein
MIGSVPDFVHAVGTSAPNLMSSQFKVSFGTQVFTSFLLLALKEFSIPVNRLYKMVVKAKIYCQNIAIRAAVVTVSCTYK